MLLYQCSWSAAVFIPWETNSFAEGPIRCAGRAHAERFVLGWHLDGRLASSSPHTGSGMARWHFLLMSPQRASRQPCERE